MVAGVRRARAVTLPHGGAVGALCAFGGWFSHCDKGWRLTGVLSEVELLDLLSSSGPAERFADISWRSHLFFGERLCEFEIQDSSQRMTLATSSYILAISSSRICRIGNNLHYSFP